MRHNKEDPMNVLLAEVLTIRLTKPVDQLTTWEHLLLGKLLEEIKRVRRSTK